MTNHGYSQDISPDDVRHALWEKQRTERGFDDTELWNLDTTIAKFILPRLVAFRDYTHSTPASLTQNEWTEKLAKMVYAFEFLSSEDKYTTFDNDQWEVVGEGLKLFGENFSSLWN